MSNLPTILFEGPRCKCACRKYYDANRINYWYHHHTDEIYSTDCHKSNPIKAIGIFRIGDKIIEQT